MASWNPFLPDSPIYNAVMITSLVLSLCLVFYISGYNFIWAGYIFATYEVMVKKKLDETMELFNKNEHGIQWLVLFFDSLTSIGT